MAFKNKKQQKGKRSNNNGYFAQNVQRFGKDFLKRKRPDDVKRDAPRVFKDIAFCNGYVGSITEYFLDPQFVKNLILAANESYQEYSLTVVGLTTYIQQQTGSGVIAPQDQVQEMIVLRSKQKEAYDIILAGLNNIIIELDNLKMGKDRLAVYMTVCGFLKQISFNLKNYRYVI